MTITVKLDPVLEQQLRQRAAGNGMSTSEVIRAALLAYLAEVQTSTGRSAFALGEGLFGRHAGDPALAQDRKHALADEWAVKHRARGR
ncbi:MAG: ribbon-helix-helix protein, CopG family [Ideonella sp.]|nr:ribbon-helix-helix protein, CopG family [Ideonella sp.]MCC7456695.1 ribbon-helix-helix protein, CopG family [Nitrospira sp.]